MALELVNVANVYDNLTLNLGGQAYTVATANVGGTTYLFASAVAESGLSVFSVAADGALTNVFNLNDDATLNLRGHEEFATAEYAGETYLFVGSGHEGGVSLFRVGADGHLTNTANVADAGALNLNGIYALGAATIGSATYFFATGYSTDSGISVFSVGPGGTLSNVFNYPYTDVVAPTYYISDMATVVLGGTTYLAVSNYDSISVLAVNADGSLTGVTNIADSPGLNLNVTTSVTAAVVGSTTYLFAAGYSDNGISVFSVGSGGSLTNVANINDDATLKLGGVHALTTVVHDGTTYLLAASFNESGMSAFAVGTDGSLTPIDSLSDDATMALDGAVDITSTVVGGHPLAFVAASYENGVGAFTLDHLPTATNLDQTLSYTEDGGPVALNDIVVTDLDAGDTITATLTLANPAAGALTTAGGGTYFPLIGGWTVTGTVAEVNAALAAVSFVPAANNDVNTTVTSYVEDWTHHGPADGIIALNVTAVNDAPVFANVDPAISSTEQVFAIADGNITIHDPELDALNGGLGDYGGASITITRQGGANPEDLGWIDFAGASFTAGFSGLEYGGLVFAGISGGGGTATISFTSAQTPATTALVNEVIQRFMYANGSDNPPASIVVDYTFNDGNAGAQGTGGPGITTASMTVNITPVNDEPVNSVPGAQTVDEDGGLVFPAPSGNAIGIGNSFAISLVHPDAISIHDVDDNNGSETTQLSVSHGTLTFGGSSAGLSSFTNGGASIMLTGSVAGINTALSSLTYTPNADFNGADVLTVATSDNGNTGGGALGDVDTVDITVNAVADVVTDNLTTNEDTAITANVLTGTNGASADNFENAGRAISGVTQGLHGSVAFLANGAVTYTPNADYNGTDSFTYTVTSGGVSETGAVNVGVNAINDAPVAQNGAASGNENTVIHGTLVATDIDSASLTYSRVAQAAHGTAVVNADGTFSYTPNAGYSGPDSFTFKAFDGLADSNVAAVTLAVAPGLVHLTGTPGDDSFTALPGNEWIDALRGNDTVSFNFRLVDATVSYSGNQVIIDGPGSHTVLTGFERYVFTDGTVDNNDGNALVDDLFYYSRYHDVWNAHIDADVHYNLWGWHEWRDPSAFFSTGTYLSLYQDVKASGVNPLIQFDRAGWAEGRIPSFNFDPHEYLEYNPDVAAARIDPLEHFLANGAQEGRQPHDVTGLVAANGFDFEYYLQHNPDVAAAHVDPFEHFQSHGWREGRNPNELFDTRGYLATYADVAAAGINPLDHYHLYGWTEGRDPSPGFDTADYLSHYPDVAAAHIDPLTHFLQNGIYEGRSPFADGVWG